MNENAFYLVLLAIFAVIGFIKFMRRVDSTNYGTRGSYYSSDADFDFDLLNMCLIVGVIGIILWLCMGGFTTPIGAPTTAASAPYQSYHVGRSTTGILARALLGGRPGFRFLRR